MEVLFLALDSDPNPPGSSLTHFLFLSSSHNRHHLLDRCLLATSASLALEDLD